MYSGSSRLGWPLGRRWSQESESQAAKVAVPSRPQYRQRNPSLR